ncbi:sugar ABC transporter substrate-binding protein [Bacillus sp. IITD106]|nr:sugar ABC transporter substrate-binding protein [Bacillus sp. IITD106]
MKNKLNIIFTCLITMVFLVTGCAGNSNVESGKSNSDNSISKADKEKIVIGFSNWSRRFPFYVDLEQGLKDVADEHGVELITHDANGSLPDQTEQIENFITSKVDGIIIVPIDSKAAVAEVEAVNRSKIPLVTADIEVVGGGEIASHVASDHHRIGELAAEYIGDSLNGKGKVALINNPTITSIIAREEGFKKIIKEKYPDIEIVTIQNGESKREKALSITENILQVQPDLDAIYAVNDEMAQGVLQAIQAKKMDSEIILVGEVTDESIEAIEKGTAYKASIAQQPKEIGRLAMETMLKVIKGEDVDSDIAVESVLVTEENLNEYKK